MTGSRLAPFAPALQLRTLFSLNPAGRILSTREPNPGHGASFALIRDADGCVWAIHADVPDELAGQIDRLAQEEPPVADFAVAPVHAHRYAALLGGTAESGPAFVIPEAVPAPGRVAAVEHLAQLAHHFRGWTAEELPERSPIMAAFQDGHPVSVCFCARRTQEAAEAGVETAKPFRGRGLAARVTAAWAASIRASGRLPIYSTSWNNTASLAVARRLGLTPCASDWSLSA